MLIALIGRLNQTFGVGKEFEVITAAVLGGASLFGGIGYAFGAVVGAVLVQMVQAGMVFIQVNLYMQPMVLAAIIFLAVFFDSLRERRAAQVEAPQHPRRGSRRAVRHDRVPAQPRIAAHGPEGRRSFRHRTLFPAARAWHRLGDPRGGFNPAAWGRRFP